MIKSMLVVLYVVGGLGAPTEVKLKQEPFASVEECYTKGKEFVHELMIDPSVADILWADCLDLSASEDPKQRVE